MSRRWPPVLLELKVGLGTRRNSDRFGGLTRFCRASVGDGGVLAYLDANRLAMLIPRSDSAQIERLVAQLRDDWGVEVRQLQIDADGEPALGAPNRWLYAAIRALASWGERAAAAIGLVLVAPLLLLLALTVKISKPGPVLTVHDRLGRHGRRCRVYRFRAQATPGLNRSAWIPKLPDTCEGRLRYPPRAMSVDRLLTETRLHRLPQLWNVVRGELPLRSLAGSRTARTRPHGHPGLSAPNRS